MKIGFKDTEGRSRRPDGRRVVYVWPLTDFDGHRNDLATARHLAWRWYAAQPAKWSSWAVGQAWDPQGIRRWDMSSAPHPRWWEWAAWPVTAPGRWVHRNCVECSGPGDDADGTEP